MFVSSHVKKKKNTGSHLVAEILMWKYEFGPFYTAPNINTQVLRVSLFVL